MTKTERNTKKRAGKGFIIAGIILFALGFYVDLRIRPLIEKTGEYQCRVMATRIINDVVYGELNSDVYDYENIARLSYGLDGEVKSVTCDAQVINRLKSRSLMLINQEVESLDTGEIGIPLGTASGISLLFGKGPVIPVKLTPKGYTNAVLISEFTSAGINQTLHRIIMEIEIDLTAVIPGYNKTITIKTDYIVAQTIIVGIVPGAYTQIISDNGDLINKISDYRAEEAGS